MLTLRKSNDRGQADHGWLKSSHTFSFADYYDPSHMGFGPLRVINEDFIAGGGGFGSHPHRDMEIITYIVSGSLEHKDSMGNQSVIVPGEVQRMTAGTGVVHSEYNEKQDASVHLLQIWIQPSQIGLKPSYEQKSFEKELNSKPLVLVASPTARQGSVAINQDAELFVSRLQPGQAVDFDIKPGRRLWFQVIRGRVRLDGATSDALEISAGDAVAVTSEFKIRFESLDASEALLFDLP